MPLTVALWNSEEKAGMSISEKLVEAVETVVAVVDEAEITGASATVQANAELARALHAEELIAPLFYRSLGALGVEGAEGWLAVNGARVAELERWLARNLPSP
jgi:hypothetical protein